MALAYERARADAAEGTTLLADHQWGGRGRRGRHWFSPPGAGLWCTTVLRPPTSQPWQTLGLVAGAAAYRALHRWDIDGLGLKWPNDVLVGPRKLGGILLEAEVNPPGPFVLVGIGINIAARSEVVPPADVAERYVGLAEVSPLPVDREAVLHAWLAGLAEAYRTWLASGLQPVLATWRQADVLLDQPVVGDGPEGPVEGIGAGILADGALAIRVGSEVVAVHAGEIAAPGLPSPSAIR